MVQVRLVIEPALWWRGRHEGPLVIDATRVEAVTDDDDGGTWAVVEGWRLLPGGGRVRARELVRASALASSLADGVLRCAGVTQLPTADASLPTPGDGGGHR